ncbi:MAG TPA: tetratricopeptide repeat protein [Candidatus Aquicultoraceae bacterium]|nr:tetratricopeptide repeat protein [Candidatus Aquicultoraceae bacterium]
MKRPRTASFDRGEMLRKADEYRLKGKVGKAISEYEKVLSADPKDIEVHAKVAPLYVRTGRKDRAKASLRLVTAWYEKRGFVEKAIALLRLYLSVDRRDLGSYLQLADLYIAKAHPRDALEVLETARRNFRSKRFVAEAIAIEKKILDLSPDDFPIQVSLVRHLAKSGRVREAHERLWRMESQTAARRQKKRWITTRRLLLRHAPSLTTFLGYFVSPFLSPVPYRSKGKRRLAT